MSLDRHDITKWMEDQKFWGRIPVSHAPTINLILEMWKEGAPTDRIMSELDQIIETATLMKRDLKTLFQALPVAGDNT